MSQALVTALSRRDLFANLLTGAATVALKTSKPAADTFVRTGASSCTRTAGNASALATGLNHAREGAQGIGRRCFVQLASWLALRTSSVTLPVTKVATKTGIFGVKKAAELLV